jgi:hypothetical protein
MSDMMNGSNTSPYSRNEAGPAEGVTELMISHLKNTRPWVIFIAVLIVVGAALMALFGVLSMVGGACLGARGGGASPFRGLGGGSYGAITAVAGLIYLGAAVLEIPVIVYLFRFAGSINSLINSGRAIDLESALRHQQAYWKYVGILSIVAIVIAVIAVFVGIVVGVSAGLGGVF